MVDKTWAEYERELSDAIASLVAGGVDAATWVRVLVPFVACMLVRGPDFGGRFGRRMAALGLDDIDGGYTPADNANLARLMELQRLLGPVAVAKWVVVRFPGQGSLLTNDLGYTPFRNRARGEAGIAVPLGPSHALTVTPRREGRVAVVRSGRWVPEVEHVAAAPGDREGLNRAVSAAAQRFLFGPDEEFVGEWLRAAPPAPPPPEPVQLGFITGTLAVAHEFTWHRLAPALERNPADGGPWDFPLDVEGLTRGWAPKPFLPANLPEFPPALRREGPFIMVEFYDPTDHFDAVGLYNRAIVLFDSGRYEQSVEALDALLNLTPDEVGAFYYKGTALAKLGRHQAALKAYDAALDLNPGDAEVLFNKGIALDELGRPEDAVAAYDAVLKSKPNHADALINKAAVLTELGRHAAALESLEAGLAARPDDPSVLANKGAVLSELGRHEDAMKALDTALQVRPRDADVLANKGSVLGKLGKHDEAVKAFGAALEIRPDHELALRNKIVALAKQGKEEAASKLFHQGWRDRERLSHKGTLLARFAKGRREGSEE